MNETLIATQALGENLLVTGMGLFALFCIGIVITTVIQEFVRSRVRNGKGNIRSSDTSWPTQLLLEIRSMNSRLQRIEKCVSNDLTHAIYDVLDKIQERERKLDKETR